MQCWTKYFEGLKQEIRWRLLTDQVFGENLFFEITTIRRAERAY